MEEYGKSEKCDKLIKILAHTVLGCCKSVLVPDTKVAVL